MITNHKHTLKYTCLPIRNLNYQNYLPLNQTRACYGIEHFISFHDHFLNIFFEFRSRSSVMGQNDSEEVVKLHHEVIEQAKYQGAIFL